MPFLWYKYNSGFWRARRETGATRRGRTSAYLNTEVIRLLHGDCLPILPTIPDNSIDAIVCDPPYHLSRPMGIEFNHKRNGDGSDRTQQPNYQTRGFMNSQWDGGDIAFRPDVWRECVRVLKPGGYMVAFASCRGYHRMVVAIEDAGFVIHPMLCWIFGSGFPKACNASKAIDKHLGAEREVIADHPNPASSSGLLKDGGGGWSSGAYLTAPATPEAAQWDGWAYGLQAMKPACEPICLAQKPMIGTGAENILEWGVGALNIDGCRVGTEQRVNPPGSTKPRVAMGGGWREDAEPTIATGRWPANVIHDGLDEPWARYFYSAKASKRDRAGSKHPTVKPIKLMQWLCKLITPPGGTILDPFAGSGTTGEAAATLGFDAILIERELEYFEDCQRRLAMFVAPE